MKLPSSLTTLVGSLLLCAPAWPCSAFLVCGSERVLMGNNEDYWDVETRLWFVPARDGRHGVAYLGYANRFPQGGMNDAGLAFDGFATEAIEIEAQAGKEAFRWSLPSEVMETCATVEEVIAFLERYDLSALDRSMLFYADASGDAVILDGGVFLRKQGAFQAVTNVRPSRCADVAAACPRYAAAVAMLGERQETSIALCRRILAATHQEGGTPTQYSNVFDLASRRIHLYHFHNFEEVVELDLRAELEKGERVLEIPALFRATHAFQAFRAARERSAADKARQPVSVDPARLDECAGDYEIEIPGEGRARFVFRREQAGLRVESERFLRVGNQRAFELTALSDHEFALDQPGWSLVFGFQRGAQGTVEGLEVRSDQVTLQGSRVARVSKD